MSSRLESFGGCCAALGLAIMLVACGSGGRTTTPTTGPQNTLDVYSSLPLAGPEAPEAASIVNGIRLALAEAHHRAGRFKIHYISLSDATMAAGGWDPGATAADARQARADPRTIYYIGEFDSPASEVSIPILNQAGIPQLSPANTYVGLTVRIRGITAPDEPERYYPTATRTYLRLLPNDSVQAAADLQAMMQAGCRRLAIASDGEGSGAELAELLKLDAPHFGLSVVSDTRVEADARTYLPYAIRLRQAGTDCFEFTGTPWKGGIQITRDISAAAPAVKIFGPASMCTSAWTRPSAGGVPADLDPKLECTGPAPVSSGTPSGRQFLVAYDAAYHVSRPGPYAVYGYEAMKLGLDTIAGLGSNGSDRADLLKALFATRDRDSPLGAYGFDADGDTTARSYGLYRVGPGGALEPYRLLTPPEAVGSPRP